MVNIKFRATNTSEKKKWGNSIREEHTVVFICIFFKPNGVYLWFFIIIIVLKMFLFMIIIIHLL